MPFVASGHERCHGRTFGTGHCVPFVREVTGAPITTQWRRGDPVRGSDLAPGTAIATFDPNGRYGNHVDLRSHAAILLSVNDDGLLVMDQWLNQPVHERVIRYRNGNDKPANDGDAYYVIEMEA
jgi:hypothetical protein